MIFIDKDTPCIGLCYHNKKKCYKNDQCTDYEKGYPLNVIGTYVTLKKYFAASIGFTKKYFSIDENVPCVGICQYNKQKCDEDEQCVDYDKGSLL